MTRTEVSLSDDILQVIDVLARCGFSKSFPHQLDDRKAFADGDEVRLQSFVVQNRQAGILQ